MYEDLKWGYFCLFLDNMILEIIFYVVFNLEDDMYDLYLKIKMENEFLVCVGGNVFMISFNQIYLGFVYQNLNYYLKEFMFDGQLGKIYNNVQFMVKVDFVIIILIFYCFIVFISIFDYFKKDKFFFKNDKLVFNQKDE